MIHVRQHYHMEYVFYKGMIFVNGVSSNPTGVVVEIFVMFANNYEIYYRTDHLHGVCRWSISRM